MTSDTDRSSLYRLALTLFFGSGLCALAYETIWVRQLTLSYGISVYAVSTVLAAYMFGLGAGAWWVGRWSVRIRNPLRVYAWFELGIVAYTFGLYFVLARGMPAAYAAGHGVLSEVPFALALARFMVTFALLAVPTALMGGTLPVLIRLFESRERAVGASVGTLYGINTLGGVTGTAVAGFWLLKELGIFATMLAALLLNLTVVALAFAASRGRGPLLAPAAAAAPAAPGSTRRLPAGRLIFAVLFLSGFTSLSYEVMWNRSLLLYTHNSTYAFSLILIIFLAGVALGSLLVSRFPASLTGLRQLGALQVGLGVCVWLSIPLTGRMPGLLGRVTDLLGSDSWFAALSTIVVGTGAIVLVPTILMGMSFPIATALLEPGHDEVGAVTGKAYATLTLGNILGSLLTGFLFIEWLGLRNAFAVGIAMNLFSGSALLLFRPGRVATWAGAVLGTAALVGVFLGSVDRDVFRRYYAQFAPNILFYKEEVTDNVLVYERGDQRYIFYSDGRGTAGTGTDFTNRLSGHIPMLLHPDPRSVLSICFGVGNTLSAIAQHEPDALTCVELSPGAIEAARFFPTNRDVLSTPNLQIEIGDGRNFLLRSRDTFDVIQLEPPELHQAGVVNLYTRDFYELARRRLSENGIVCQWFSTMMPEYEQRMVIRAFQDVFPDASLWSGSNTTSLLLLGSPRPIRIRPERFLERAQQPAVHADLDRMGIDPMQVLTRHLLGPESLREYVGDAPPVTDDRTYVDFSIPRSGEAGFGVFVYNTFQEFGTSPAKAAMVLRNLELETRAESPAYLFDLSGSSAQEQARFLGELDAAVSSHRLDSAADLESQRGAYAARDGDLDEAEAHQRAALAIVPDHAMAHFRLGMLLARRGDLLGAEEHLRASLAAGHPPARTALRRVRRERRRQER